MYPLLVKGQPYYVDDTTYDEMEEGMIVRRRVNHDYAGYTIVVHKLGEQVGKGWVTYGINNHEPDEYLLNSLTFQGRVIPL